MDDEDDEADRVKQKIIYKIIAMVLYVLFVFLQLLHRRFGLALCCFIWDRFYFAVYFVLFPYIQEDIRFLGTILYDFSDVDWYPFCLNAGGTVCCVRLAAALSMGAQKYISLLYPCLGLLDLFGFDRYPPDAVLFQDGVRYKSGFVYH